MKGRIASMLFAVSAAVSGVRGADAPKSKPKLEFGNVVVSSETLHIDRGGVAEWRVGVPAQGKLTARLFDARDVLVAVIAADLDVKQGTVHLTWNGAGNDGRAVPNGFYVLRLELKFKSGMISYDPTASSGGELQSGEGARYNPESSELRYHLKQPSLVRVLAGWGKDGPVLKTVMDWAPRPAGWNVTPWDGWDGSHVTRLGADRNLQIHVWAYSLPANAILVMSGDGIAAQGDETVAGRQWVPTTDATVRRTSMRKPAPLPYNHWYHDREKCHDPLVTLVGGSETSQSVEGSISVHGSTEFVLSAPPEDTLLLRSERFELGVYIDGLFQFEEEVGFLPFPFSLKPELFVPGDHVVSVMVRTINGHFGAASVRVTKPKNPVGQGEGQGSAVGTDGGRKP